FGKQKQEYADTLEQREQLLLGLHIAGDDDVVVDAKLLRPGSKGRLVVVERGDEVANEHDERPAAVGAKLRADGEQGVRRLAFVDGAEISHDDVAIARVALELTYALRDFETGGAPNRRRMRHHPASACSEADKRVAGDLVANKRRQYDDGAAERDERPEHR